ncbi:hypothetical protein LIPSTDRAFT_69518 [Lipomyces starkeyi NRRL Y-11557]|uniref:Uncharacterized protein n=1 Tax=Lipomyces starkeyi NRRL Y-11557 TaxID=675824 RepID=A0A1E3QC65_LIPST|nr:hypothetical protein LIPSTDRAFT_69518 [Lipomyces starkeyi NRRL Y-11557]
MTDCQGIVRSHKRPFLARPSNDAPLLLGERTLAEIGVTVSLRTEENGRNKWQYDLDVGCKPFIKTESSKRFKKRLRSSPKVYAIVAFN